MTATELAILPATISVAEAGRVLGIGPQLALQAARDGTLPTVRIGQRLRVVTPRLIAMLDATNTRGVETEA